MSKIKFKKIYIFLVMAFFSLFIFGCDQSTPVNDIYFDIDNQIVMLLGETYSPKVIVAPSYATNPSYTISSTNNNIVTVHNNQITAVAEGSAMIKVVSKDNDKLQDMIGVRVMQEQTTLSTPSGFKYNEDSQSFTFNLVENAVSYKLQVNDKFVEIGNATSFTLNQLQDACGFSYDTDLTAKVMAVAPTYTNAFVSSAYTEEITIFQASAVNNVQMVNGILTFDKTTTDAVYDIYFDNVLVAENLSNNNISLLQLDKKYNNQEFKLKILAKQKSGAQKLGVSYYPSQEVALDVSVMDTPNIVMTDTKVSWQNISKVKEYLIYIDGDNVASTQNNYFDLETLTGNKEIKFRANDYQLTVKAVMQEGATNLAQSEKTSNIITFNRLATPNNVSLACGKIVWDANTYAKFYNTNLSYTHGEEFNFESAINNNEYDLDSTLPEGVTYNFAVSSVGVESNGVYYMPSKLANLTFVKKSNYQPVIEEYSLKFNAESGTNYKILLDNTVLISSHPATSTQVDIDLSTFDFAVGGHEIKVIHLGDNTSSIDSNSRSVEFTQLESIGAEDIVIVDCIASVEKSDINANAESIIIKIMSDGVEKSSSDDLSIRINSENLGADYLASGDYNINVVVSGNGSSTFSPKTQGNAKNIKVLAVPSVQVFDRTSGQITISADNTTKYNICNADGDVLKEITGEYNANLSSAESKTIKFQAVGDQQTTFNSILSNAITISKVATPTLTFDNKTGIISKAVETGHTELFLHNDVANVSYGFNTAFTDFVVGNNKFELSLLAKSNTDVNYYQNSDVYTLNIERIDAGSTTLDVNTNNELVINSNIETQYGLVVEFVIDGNTMLFETVNGKLKYQEIELNYTFIDGVYTVKLLNDNYSPIIPLMTSGFSVKVKYTAQTGTNIVDSEFSSTLNVGVLDTATITRTEQKIIFNDVLATENVENYLLCVNNSEVVDISSCATYVSSRFEVNMVDLLKLCSSIVSIDQGYNSLAVISLNKDENVNKISQVGEEFFFTLAKNVELILTKQDEKDILSFEYESLNYPVNYVVDICNKEAGVITNSLPSKNYSVEAGNSGIKTICLDDENIDGEIYISCAMYANHSFTEGGKTIYIYNARVSEELVLTRLATIEGAYYSEGKLNFGIVDDNLAGYNVFIEDNGVYNKYNTSLIPAANTNYNVEINVLKKFKITAVSSQNTNVINSLPSDIITVDNAVITSATMSDGDLILNMGLSHAASLLNSVDDCQLVIANLKETVGFDVNKIIDINSVDILEIMKGNPETGTSSSYEYIDYVINLSGITLTIDAIQVGLVAAGEDSLFADTLDVKLVVKHNAANASNTYYADSVAKVIAPVYKLFAPVEIKKSTDRIISWTANDLNKVGGNVFNGRYTVKFVYNELEYLTSDSLLKYHNGSEYVSYPNPLTETQAYLPNAYDFNENGIVEENEKFGAGIYQVYVATQAKDVSGHYTCDSDFKFGVQIEILPKPTLSVENGILSWEKTNATHYNIVVTQIEDDSTQSIQTYTNSCDLSSDGYRFKNILKVTAQACSNKTNIITGEVSEELFVYIPSISVASAKIDDGHLVISLNKYFSSLKIDFINNNAAVPSISKEIDHVAELNKYLAELSEGSKNNWMDFSKAEITDLENSLTTICVDLKDIEQEINGSYTINISTKGNSATDSESFAILNSKTNISVSGLTMIKIEDENTNGEIEESLLNVKTGVATIGVCSAYQATNLQYNFLNETYPEEDIATNPNKIWHNTRIYMLTFISNDVEYSMLVMDFAKFNDLLASGYIDDADYEDKLNTQGVAEYGLYAIYSYGDLKINVFNNNEIRLNDLDSLHFVPYERIYNQETNVFEYTFDDKDADEDDEVFVDLKSGGTFVVKIRMLGGDSVNNFGYLDSSLVSSKTFLRYGQNPISTNSGWLVLDDMREIDEEGRFIDHPVYELNVAYSAKIGNADTDVKESIYLCYNIDDAKTVTGIPDAKYILINEDQSGDAFVKSNTITDENGEEIEKLYIYFDITKYFTYYANSYTLSVKTLAGLGNENTNSGDYFLDSHLALDTDAIFKPTFAEFNITDGFLTFKQSYIDNDGLSYFTDYEITITHNEIDYIYTISTQDENVKLNLYNRTITYILPTSITDGEKTLDLVAETEYSIKIRPLASAEKVVNGSYEKDGQEYVDYIFSIAKRVTDVTVENGEIRWKSPTNAVIINIEFEDGDPKLIQIDKDDDMIRVTDTPDGDGNYIYKYIVAETGYPIVGSGLTHVLDSRNYDISISLKGNGNVLNSQFSEKITRSRLGKVNNDGVVVDGDNLTWLGVHNATRYLVTLKGNKTYTYTTSELNINVRTTADDNGQYLEAGDYKVSIKALGDTYINGVTYQVVVDVNANPTIAKTFRKLSPITNCVVNGNTVTWDENLNAVSYLVKFIQKADGATFEVVAGTNTCDLPAGLQGDYSIHITAIGNNTSFNSDVYVTTASLNRPKAVGTIYIDETNYRFYFSVDENDLNANDKVVISYDEMPNGESIIYKKADAKKYTAIEYDKEVVYYYYEMANIGTYTNFSVQVVRSESSVSDITKCDTRSYVFDIFEEGNGSESAPYGISNQEQLLRIANGRFISKYYKLENNINLDMTNVEVLNRITTYGAVIAGKFTGNIDGYGKAILTNFGEYNQTENTYTVDLRNNNFALFGNLESAIIKNVTIGQVATADNSESASIIIKQTFDTDMQNMIKSSMIANKSTSATLEKVKLANIKFVINNSASAKDIYIAGLINEANSTNILGCEANINIEINGNDSVDSYIGGLVSVSSKSNYDYSSDLVENVVDININSTNNNAIFTYIGGVIAKAEETVNGYYIKNTNVTLTLNAKSLNVGGVAGYAKYLNIDNCDVDLVYNIANQINCYTNIAGVVGSGESVTIYNCNVEFDYSKILFNSTDNYRNVGLIAGILTKDSTNNKIINCGTTGIADTTTITNNKISVLGIYGRATTGAAPEYN